MRLNSFEYLASEAVKTWMQGSERQFDTLTVGEYGTFDEVAIDERELEQLLDNDGLETAMNLAETMAVAGGILSVRMVAYSLSQMHPQTPLPPTVTVNGLNLN